MSRKTIYYHDPLHDDFAPTNGHIRPKPIGADFPYEHPSPVWQALAFVVYRLIMTPFLFLYCKLVFGLRIENRKVLRELPGGYFLYGNHTNTLADAFIPTLLAFPRRASIVTAAEHRLHSVSAQHRADARGRPAGRHDRRHAAVSGRDPPAARAPPGRHDLPGGAHLAIL